MNAPGLENFLTWLLNHSLQAGALVLFVLLVQRVFRRQLTHRWRFALWWIVLARLVLPFGPESAPARTGYQDVIPRSRCRVVCSVRSKASRDTSASGK